MRNWEETFRTWAKGPGQTEKNKCDNAIRAIKDAINASEKLKDRNVEVFLQGSYKNRVNVKQDSDVDVGVVCRSVFFTDYPEGTNDETFGNSLSNYSFKQYKADVEEALVKKFGRNAVKRGNKAFDIKENSYRVDADVAPFVEHRRYKKNGSYILGVELKSDNGERIINWPVQHYQNGVEKNTATNRRYKRIVRIVKKLSIEMEEVGIPEARGIMGFLCECLIWNVSNSKLGDDTYFKDVTGSLLFLYEKLGTEESDDWGEVSELKYLFRGSPEGKKSKAQNFVKAALEYIIKLGEE